VISDIRAVALCLLLLVAAAVAGCAGTGTRTTGPRSRCGACHLTPDAHSVLSAAWEEVKGNHIERLHLTVPIIEQLEAEILCP
jgi:hypothetical protein